LASLLEGPSLNHTLDFKVLVPVTLESRSNRVSVWQLVSNLQRMLHTMSFLCWPNNSVK